MKKNLINKVLRKNDYTKEEVELLLNELKKRGFISFYIINDEKGLNRQAIDWLIDFWTPDKSVYLREKKGKVKLYI